MTDEQIVRQVKIAYSAQIEAWRLALTVLRCECFACEEYRKQIEVWITATELLLLV